MPSSQAKWRPGAVRCCSCGAEVAVSRSGDVVDAGAGILPAVPGAICGRCEALTDGPVLADVRAPAMAHILLAQEFERPTAEAVQAVLDLYGWQPEVVAAAARRLHADGHGRSARGLLDAAAAATGDPGFYQVEQAALRLLDGEVGKAHDLLLETLPEDHPRWHLQRGNLAFAVGHHGAAREHWREQVQASPDEPLGWQTLGWHLLHECGEPAAAAACFRGACAMFPRHQEFRAWLGEALWRQGDPPGALAELEAARRLEPVDAEFTRGLEALIVEVRRAASSGETGS